MRRNFAFWGFTCLITVILVAIIGFNHEPQMEVEEEIIEVTEEVKEEIEERDENDPIYDLEATFPEIEDFEIVARVVAAESRGEPFEGQILVARCIWNTACRKGISMKEVVEMKNRYASPASMEVVTEELKTAVYYGILGIELPVEEEVEYFYSIKDGFYSRWHEENLEYVITIGNHKFFKAP